MDYFINFCLEIIGGAASYRPVLLSDSRPSSEKASLKRIFPRNKVYAVLVVVMMLKVKHYQEVMNRNIHNIAYNNNQ